MADFPDRFKIRRDTAANWTSNNPTLLEGELGWESDTKKLRSVMELRLGGALAIRSIFLR